jgi:anti-anti-sigma factor
MAPVTTVGTPAVGPQNIEVREQQGVVVLKLLGEHDLSTFHDLQVALAERIVRDQPAVVSLDEATFIDSSTIGLFIRMDQAMALRRGRRLVVHSDPATAVDRILVISGARHRLVCRDGLSDAILVAGRAATT